MPAQVDTFTAEFSVLPSVIPMDGLVSLSRFPAYDYSQVAVAVRFNQQGTIDARNGDAYAAAATVPYELYKEYRFQVKVSVPTHRYSVYVTPPGGGEVTLAQNYAFRSEQAAVNQLNTWNRYASVGQFMVCGFDLPAVSPVRDDTRTGSVVRDGNVPVTGGLFTITGVPIAVGANKIGGPQVTNSGIYIMRRGGGITKVLVIR
jgi:hypothetical protein